MGASVGFFFVCVCVCAHVFMCFGYTACHIASREAISLIAASAAPISKIVVHIDDPNSPCPYAE